MNSRRFLWCFFQRKIAARHWNKIEFLSGKRRVFMYSDEKTLDIVSMPCKKTKYECKGCFQPLWMLLQEKSWYSCSSFVMVWELEKNGKISCHEKINTVLSARDFRHDFNLLLVKSVFGWDLLVGCKMVTLSSLTATKSRSSREDIGGRYTTTKKVLWHNLTKSQKESWLKTAQRTIPDAELLENGFWLVVEKHSRRPAILIKDAQLKGEGKREEGRKSSNFSVTLKRYYQSCVNYH